MKVMSYLCLLILANAGLFHVARCVKDFDYNESIEIFNRQLNRSYRQSSQYSSIVELLLGDLDTFHSPTKTELTREKEKRRS